MINVTCPSCKKVHKADESLLGKRVKCKDCGVMFEVMSNGPQPVQQPNTWDREIKQMAAAAPAAVTGPTGGGISKKPVELPKDVPPAKAERPFGLVWVVFYWIIAGVVCLPAGYVLGAMGGALGGTAEITGGMFGSRGFTSAGALVGALFELLGLLLFHYGLLLLVACYGLWTFRRWGLSLARGLAVASVVLNVVVFIISLISRAGIVATLVGAVTSVGILVYLYGSDNLRDRLQRYTRNGGLQGGEWNQYK